MNASAANEKTLDDIKRMLSSLKGVKCVFYLTKTMRTGLEKIEKSYPPLGPLSITNDGVFACLQRTHIVCIIKDKHFRPPPVPTVVLIDEDGNVIGRELLPGEKLSLEKEKKVITLGKDFVIFFERGKGKGAKFVLPPVPFKEVDDIECVERSCSSSPSTAGDLFLRQCADLEDDPKLASILVGFDLC